MSDTMREAFEKWAESKGYRTDTYAEVPDDYWDDTTQSAWRAWQAAQSVPVVGDLVAWLRKDKLQHLNTFGPALCNVYATEKPGTVALIEKPTHSIPATELDALRNAARALNALLDRELHILDKEVVFPFESHTQAWNHIVDARQIAEKAMAIAKERQS